MPDPSTAKADCAPRLAPELRTKTKLIHAQLLTYLVDELLEGGRHWGVPMILSSDLCGTKTSTKNREPGVLQLVGQLVWTKPFDCNHRGQVDLILTSNPFGVALLVDTMKSYLSRDEYHIINDHARPNFLLLPLQLQVCKRRVKVVFSEWTTMSVTFEPNYNPPNPPIVRPRKKLELAKNKTVCKINHPDWVAERCAQDVTTLMWVTKSKLKDEKSRQQWAQKLMNMCTIRFGSEFVERFRQGAEGRMAGTELQEELKGSTAGRSQDFSISKPSQMANMSQADDI